MTFFIPLLFLLDLLISYQTQTVLGFGNLILGILGGLGSLAGLALWGWGFVSLGKSFSVLPKAKELKTKGAYKFFRHPIYLGIGLSCLGISLGMGSRPGTLFTLLIVIPLNIFRAKLEEKELAKKFGDEYTKYKKTTII